MPRESSLAMWRGDAASNRSWSSTDCLIPLCDAWGTSCTAPTSNRTRIARPRRRASKRSRSGSASSSAIGTTRSCRPSCRCTTPSTAGAGAMSLAAHFAVIDAGPRARVLERCRLGRHPKLALQARDRRAGTLVEGCSYQSDDAVQGVAGEEELQVRSFREVLRQGDAEERDQGLEDPHRGAAPDGADPSKHV